LKVSAVGTNEVMIEIKNVVDRIKDVGASDVAVLWLSK